jgi:hypothetical protein
MPQERKQEPDMRSLPVRTWRVAAAPLFLGLALVLGACGGGGGGDAPATPAPQDGGGALSLARPGELTTFVQDRLRKLGAQGRLPRDIIPLGSGGLPSTSVAMSPDTAPTGGELPRSGTLLQEEGVDEADLIQTDGSHFYTLHAQAGAPLQLQVHRRAADGRALALGSLSLPADGALDVRSDGMVFSADRRSLTVLSETWSPAPAGDVCPEVCLAILPQWMHASVGVQRIDVGDPAAAAAGERLSIDGFLVDSRRVGDTLYVVTAHRPVLALENLPASAGAAEREAAIGRLTAAELLPRVRRNGGASTPLLADTDCYLQGANASLSVQFTTITAIDLRSSSLAATSRCFVGGSEALYMSTGNLYLATTRWSYDSDTPSIVFPGAMRTDIHKFALQGGSVVYRGSGVVDGHLGWDAQRKSLRLSEHNGDLRVLTFTGQEGWATIQDAGGTGAKSPSPARLTVLRESAGSAVLETVATLPNAARSAPIGKAGEQVHGVRFVGDRGYVVTFRRVDPLYVLDLSDPADPQAVGELEVTGFSEHLVPLANGLLLGVGRDADADGTVGGIKVALFDVSRPERPSERASLVLGSAGSGSALDHSRHGLNLLQVGDVARIALPVNLSTSPYAGWQQGLQRFEVDTAARTLRPLPLLAAGSADGTSALWGERSVQVGDWVYHLAHGTLNSHPW